MPAQGAAANTTNVKAHLPILVADLCLCFFVPISLNSQLVKSMLSIVAIILAPLGSYGCGNSLQSRSYFETACAALSIASATSLGCET